MDVVPNRWYAILDPREIPAGKPVGVERLGRKLVLWRAGDGQLRCLEDRCPHRGASLSLGRLEGDCVACPFHGFTFDARGECTHVPAHPKMRIPRTMSSPAYVVREAHDLVWLWTGPPERAPAEVPFFDFDGWSFRGSQFTKVWNVHYTRAIENQLDYAHLPFVHSGSIGRGLAPEMNVVTEQDGDRLVAYRAEGGTDRIEFLGPNIWRLVLGPSLHQFIAFAPVNEHKMQYYLRTYQRMVTLPGLDAAFGLVNRLANPVILSQDQRVVESQSPDRSSLTNGEVYVPSDRPIVAYLRWRQSLIRASEHAA